MLLWRPTVGGRPAVTEAGRARWSQSETAYLVEIDIQWVAHRIVKSHHSEFLERATGTASQLSWLLSTTTACYWWCDRVAVNWTRYQPLSTCFNAFLFSVWTYDLCPTACIKFVHWQHIIAIMESYKFYIIEKWYFTSNKVELQFSFSKYCTKWCAKLCVSCYSEICLTNIRLCRISCARRF